MPQLVALTDLCNCRCRFCPPRDAEPAGHRPAAAVRAALEQGRAQGCTTAQLTGGQPTP